LFDGERSGVEKVRVAGGVSAGHRHGWRAEEAEIQQAIDFLLVAVEEFEFVFVDTTEVPDLGWLFGFEFVDGTGEGPEQSAQGRGPK